MSERTIEPIAEETFDSILGGALRLYQPRRGYRFSVEAVLLARFAAARPARGVLDLGAGCGGVVLVHPAPPCRARSDGRVSPLPGRRLARGETAARLEDFAAAAARHARHGG